MLPSYRNQSIDLLCKSINWFLYGCNASIEWVNEHHSHMLLLLYLYFQRYGMFLRLRLTPKAFQLPFQFFFSLFFLLVTFSGRTAKSFLVNVLSQVIKKVCDQDLTHSLDTLNSIFVKIVPQVVIHGLCTGNQHSQHPKKHKKQPETRKQVIQASQSVNGRRFIGQNREKSS